MNDEQIPESSEPLPAWYGPTVPLLLLVLTVVVVLATQ